LVSVDTAVSETVMAKLKAIPQITDIQSLIF